MGFASYLEDNIERITERIHLAQSRLEAQQPEEVLRREALSALGDAKVLLAKVSRELNLATSPDMDLAHDLSRLRSEVRSLRLELAAERQKTERAEAARQSDLAAERLKTEQAEAARRRAEKHARASQEETRRLKQDFEKLPFEQALRLYDSPKLLEKHRRK